MTYFLYFLFFLAFILAAAVFNVVSEWLLRR